MKPTLPSGRYIQVYRGAVKGNTHEQRISSMTQALDSFKEVGIKGVLWHGFIDDLSVPVFQELQELCSQRGMLSLAAFGLGAKDPERAGTWIGQVAAHSGCSAVVLDMEGAWEADPSVDKPKAAVLGSKIREQAPDALVFDQPWFAPLSHWNFPWEETAAYVDVRAPQAYAMDFLSAYGARAYEITFERLKREWVKLDERLQVHGLVKPEIVTIQGYKWPLAELCDCLLKNPTCFIWCEPYPDPTAMIALKAVSKLEQLGFSDVASYQTSVGLVPDGKVGQDTVQKLGV